MTRSVQECYEWLKYQLRMLIKCSERAQNMFRIHLWRHTTCLQDNFGDDQGGNPDFPPNPTDQQILPLKGLCRSSSIRNFLIFRKLPPIPPPLTFFRVLRTCWKPHKSKDRNILHRSYTQFFSQLRFFLVQNAIFCKLTLRILF